MREFIRIWDQAEIIRTGSHVYQIIDDTHETVLKEYYAKTEQEAVQVAKTFLVARTKERKATQDSSGAGGCTDARDRCIYIGLNKKAAEG